MQLKRSLAVMAALAVLAGPAGAATIAMNGSVDGNVLTVTLEASFDGSEVSPTAFIELVVAQGSATPNGASQNPLVALDTQFIPGPGTFMFPVDWTLLPTDCPNVNGRCTVINQSNPDLISPLPQEATGPVEIATAEYILDTPGIVEIRGSMQGNNTFFGLDIPSLTTGEITVVPEPAIAGLLTLALLGLRATGRRRSRPRALRTDR